jgi:FkbM family methyltransferase
VTVISSSNPAHERGADAPRWQEKLRDRFVRGGIHVVCGPGADVPATAADNVALVGAASRWVWLRLLSTLGIRDFVSKSGLGHDFVCHVGDVAEFPYYYRCALVPELALSAAWLRSQAQPVVYDVGANVGYFATQLSQMLAAQSPQVYAFEAAPPTYAKLALSVAKLNLSSSVHPIAAAVGEDESPVRIRFSNRNSLYGQVIRERDVARAGDQIAFAESVTLDSFHAAVARPPALLKIDVEGSEPAVLRGARHLLSRDDRPAVVFEFNPTTLEESGEKPECFNALLAGYALKYVDDLSGQKRPMGSAVSDLATIRWICNLFAVPTVAGWQERWSSALRHASEPHALQRAERGKPWQS